MHKSKTELSSHNKLSILERDYAPKVNFIRSDNFVVTTGQKHSGSDIRNRNCDMQYKTIQISIVSKILEATYISKVSAKGYIETTISLNWVVQL